jgi:hypothetical protein
VNAALAIVAATFGFPPSELWALTLKELEYWLERANWWNSRGR